MKIKLTAKRLVAVLLLAALLLSPAIYSGLNVKADDLEDQLEEVEDQLDEIRGEKSDLKDEINQHQRKINGYSGEIGKLQAEVEQFQLDISELELEIEQLDLSIKLLKRQIAEKEQIITERTEEIQALEKVTDQRLREGYADYRLQGPERENVFTTADINEYFKESQYRQLLQQRTNQVLSQVVEQKIQLEYERQKLAETKRELAQDKEILKERQAELDEKQAELEKEMEKYYGALYSVQGEVNGLQSELNKLSDQEAKKKAEAEKLRQAIFNQFNPIRSGSYVAKGTMIGRQGSTGMSTGPHVHFMVHKNGASKNPCQFVPAGKFGNCNGNGRLDYPLRGSFYFTSSYGYRCLTGYGCSFHDAIDIAHSSWNAPVFAAHDGYLYKGVDGYGALYIILCENSNCGSGFKTGYWHLSSY